MKKIIPFILILITLVGLFGPIKKTHAQETPDPNPLGRCTKIGSTTGPAAGLHRKATNCAELGTDYQWSPLGSKPGEINFDCGFPYVTEIGCLASITYNIWTVSANIVRFAGHILDYFVYYSTNSTSYDNTFINKGWGAVRDVANIFFIVTLLYIAIKTVLDLDSSGSKKMIKNIVVIALVINFSLFTTKIVIDASNILAKIFYNNITSINPSGAELKPEDGGQKSISIGIVDKFDPQEIIGGPDNYKVVGGGMFVFIVLLALTITLYTAYVFLSVAVLFIARVVSLWIAMIFSPLAFISYAVPFDVPFGHKEWWDDLLKNAFLAPIFIFFLYVIVLFTGFLKTLPQYPVGDDVFQKMLSTTIPFAILMMLLMKAKGLAVKYSGKIGEAVMSGAKMVGGLALGVGAGVVAMGGKQVLGRGAAMLSENEGLKKFASTNKFGRGLLKTTQGVAGSSWDIRGVKVAGQSLASVTGMKVGDAQKGGYLHDRKAGIEKREKFASALEVGDLERAKLERSGASEETIQNINKIRKNAYINSLEKTGPIFDATQGALFSRNSIAASKLRRAGELKKKKLQDAILAMADAKPEATPAPAPAPTPPAHT